VKHAKTHKEQQKEFRNFGPLDKIQNMNHIHTSQAEQTKHTKTHRTAP